MCRPTSRVNVCQKRDMGVGVRFIVEYISRQNKVNEVGTRLTLIEEVTKRKPHSTLPIRCNTSW